MYIVKEGSITWISGKFHFVNSSELVRTDWGRINKVAIRLQIDIRHSKKSVIIAFLWTSIFADLSTTFHEAKKEAVLVIEKEIICVEIQHKTETIEKQLYLLFCYIQSVFSLLAWKSQSINLNTSKIIKMVMNNHWQSVVDSIL